MYLAQDNDVVRTLTRFHHVINSDKVFGTHNSRHVEREANVVRAFKRVRDAK